ncbi:hypothetical protein TSTA_106410 [Talaromyces stipitatus ATCC 10500]|uniref:Uncharacterized protein n=1 Tax=Talaromyces stipitatus (strain ATCC 10500 / CBS 375.48 / QM 6759 / NRRL 1006) TaxID=441959 RepID=B8MPJ4_TALSN|nr:uncharacterized protein TSTA_106410 [Talaromyces stipitatus ATCC 10500]EED14433.1 hypothetical protein TSTA_106410 [Talaromyces stipitatus ATCC 10500]
MIKEQSEMIESLQGQLRAIQTHLPSTEPTQTNQQPMYAGGPAAVATPIRHTDILHRTIDMSRVRDEDKAKLKIAEVRQLLEKDMRSKEEKMNWRCAVMVKHAKNADQVKVISRDKIEVQLVTEAAQKIAILGIRALRDQIYSVKVDNANRTAVLETDGKHPAGSYRRPGVTG